jgi:beta-ribofuranosylaminobenzene 5'-phosphate synthase
MTRLTLRAPSRLHFGLLGWGKDALRQFGGVGLMIEEPGLEVMVERALSWSSSGPLAARALELAQRIAPRLSSAEAEAGPFRIEVRRAPDAHIGLGSGTQLGMAIAQAVARFAGIEDPPVNLLARLAGRGRRSGIGIHGFASGGLIVDAGRSESQDLPTQLLHIPFPRSWSILIVLPDSPVAIHGRREMEAFEQLPDMPQATTERICRLLLLGLLPAVLELDLPTFGRSLEEIQAEVGQSFEAVQHGRFGSPLAESIVTFLRESGLQGTGQSSWGPCLYGFAELGDDERKQIRERVLSRFGLAEGSVFWTCASQSGALARPD